MKNFDWKTFLKRHSIFKNLDDKDIEQILKDKASEERDCLQGSVIIREGEFSDSVFLIGTGSVQVVLQGKDGYEINISTLGKGEFFGEMASVERIPRSATVIARENTTLLEVNGQKFCDIMRENPIIAFNVLLKLSERLRHVSEHVLAVKLRDADEKINLFNTKLDAELKAVEASLKAAQAVFEQTNTRTSEVIDSAERSRSRLTTTATVVGGIITAAIALFTWVGIEKLQNITEMEKNIAAMEQNITTLETTVVSKAETINTSARVVKKLTGSLHKIRKIAAEETILPRALDALDEKDSDTDYFYEQLLTLDIPAITKRLLFEIERRLSGEEDLVFYENLLARSLDYIDLPMEKIKAYYLYLTVLILDNKYQKTEFEKTFSNFEKYVGNYEGQRIKENQDFSIIDDLFTNEKDQKKRDLWFQSIKPIIP